MNVDCGKNVIGAKFSEIQEFKSDSIGKRDKYILYLFTKESR